MLFRSHFMPASLLVTQLQTLEEPTGDEFALTPALGRGPEALASEAIEALDLS